MLPQPAVTTTHSTFPIDIRRFRWFSRLAADYAHDYARLQDFFAGNPADAAAWSDRIAAVQAHPRQRDAVAGVLQAQQERRQAPPELAKVGVTELDAIVIVPTDEKLVGEAFAALLTVITVDPVALALPSTA